MKTIPALALLGSVLLASAPAGADVFSSQSFSGDTATLDNLPGVNLDATPGYAGTGNCVETDVPQQQYGAPLGMTGTMRGTTCSYGNFSVTTTGSSGSHIPRHDLTYGGNPPPWQQGWRP